LLVVACCCLLLLVVACCCLLLLVVACCCLLLLVVACCCLLLLVVACCCLFCWPSLQCVCCASGIHLGNRGDRTRSGVGNIRQSAALLARRIKINSGSDSHIDINSHGSSSASDHWRSSHSLSKGTRERISFLGSWRTVEETCRSSIRLRALAGPAGSCRRKNDWRLLARATR